MPTTSCKKMNKNTIQPPVAEKIETKIVKHEDVRIDNYYWLNNKENPKVIEYLKNENDYTSAMLADVEGLKDKIYTEIISRIKQDDISTPVFENGYYYYSRYKAGLEHLIYCRKKDNLQNTEEILLDVNELAKNFDYYELGDYEISTNNSLMAYSFDTLSRRNYIIKFKNLTSGKIFNEEIKNTDGSITWANDNKTIFYVVKEEETLREYKIFKHILGTSQDEDIEIYSDNNDEFYVGVDKSKSDKYIFFYSGSTLSTEYSYIEADKPESKPKIFYPRQEELEYDVEHLNGVFIIRTNYAAPNYRLMQCPENSTSIEKWTEIIPHRDEILLQDFEIFKNFLVLEEREDGLTKLRIINQITKNEHYINFNEESYTIWTLYSSEMDTEILRFGYSSLTTPTTVYDYNMFTKEKILLKQQEIVGNFKPENYITERKFATAEDGTQIPISLVYKKNLEKNGKNPLLIYGYGAYGISTDTYFISDILTLLDRGFVYAIAHVRGGEEMGTDWYEDGKLLEKQNTFTDFITCSEYLINEGYTCSDKLFAEGGSAGGLLVAAISNMRPDLYKGIIAQVPFVDVVTTMLDESIPLTTGEYDEWGDPNEKEDYYNMLSYSPYDNVEKQDYPAMLITTGLYDSQVQYWEPAKWVAKLRDMKTDDNLLLIWTNLDSGHTGATGRFEKYKETALEYVFLFKLLGIEN